MLGALMVFGVIAANNPDIINNQYVQYMFLGLFVAFVVSFIVYITYLLKTFWKWGLTLIMIGVCCSHPYLISIRVKSSQKKNQERTVPLFFLSWP